MEEIIVTNEMIQQATFMANEMGRLRNSITSGEGNIAGFLGEIAAKKFLNLPLNEYTNTYDYDLIYQNNKIDVKSKLTTVRPRSDYEASVADYNTHQDCDYYLFTRVLQAKHQNYPSHVYLMGYLPKSEYYTKARHLKKGQVDGYNKFVVRADCWNMYYRDLLPVKNLVLNSLCEA